MPALITGAHPAVRPRLVLDGPGWEGRADYERRGGYRPGQEGQDLVAAARSGRPANPGDRDSLSVIHSSSSEYT